MFNEVYAFNLHVAQIQLCHNAFMLENVYVIKSKKPNESIPK